jgi:hypothetical protein
MNLGVSLLSIRCRSQVLEDRPAKPLLPVAGVGRVGSTAGNLLRGAGCHHPDADWEAFRTSSDGHPVPVDLEWLDAEVAAGLDSGLGSGLGSERA